MRSLCSDWPDTSEYLAEEVSVVDVSGEGWESPGEPGRFCYVPDIDAGIVQGHSEATLALSNPGFAVLDCGGPAVVSGDLIALPVSASREDGSGEEGIWVFRIVDDQIQWLLAYAADAEPVAPAATDPDTTLEEEAESFCGLFGLNGSAGSGDDVLAAMTDEPAIHNIPKGFHCTDLPDVRQEVGAYNKDIIDCGDVTTNGQWSAQATTIQNPELNLGLVGILVRQHIDGQIHRQYTQYTQTSGLGNWGFHLDD